ncbi:hypothetical protein WMY93_017796 [Mugilogobius chulae]|uniref:ZP domain-containing protein n=1 Tax=Mugilogobius chulae TaxID=88201 RepID=A0AAW0NTK8_9GOBI
MHFSSLIHFDDDDGAAHSSVQLVSGEFKTATMKAIVFVCQLFLILKSDAQTIPTQCAASSTNRPPENSDIAVTCGPQYMDLSILLCPIYNANYNESLMILNGQTIEECKGTADFTVDPPVLRFKLSVTEKSLAACSNVFRIDNSVGTGLYAQFSNIQHVNISGMVVSYDPTTGKITYRPQITYLYSCQYPLQYILSNTELAVAGVNIVMNDNNGSFITTLTMTLFSDSAYSTPLIIPATGLPLKEQIFVEVTATNLSSKFNVLLDRCFATVELYSEGSSAYDLFVGCDLDPQTRINENGVSQMGRFQFEAFRFVEHKNLTVSTFYVHCITRLCNVSMCASMLPTCPASGTNRRRRETDDSSATVTSSQISVGKTTAAGESSSQVAAANEEYTSPMKAVIVCVAFLSVLLVAMGAYFTWHLRRHRI